MPCFCGPRSLAPGLHLAPCPMGIRNYSRIPTPPLPAPKRQKREHASPLFLPHSVPVDPPAPLLVGIEPNPGPPKSSALISSLTVAPRAKKKKTKVVAVTIQNKKKNGKPSMLGFSPSRQYLDQYANTLSDPFEYGPIALGYDCYLPTTLSSAYKRSFVTVNATDGSFALVLGPDAVNMVSVSSGVKTSLFSSTYLPATNVGSLAASFSEARVVSGGLRCFALFPETSAPGVLFSGTAVDLNRNDYSTTQQDWASGWPASHIGIGNRGVTTTLRPYDSGSFEFFSFPLVGYGAANIPYMTSSYIIGTGFPAGTVIWYEAILNLECMAKSNSNSSAMPVDDIPAPTMASYFPTPGELFTKVQSLISPQVVMDATMGVAQAAAGNYAGAARSAGRVISRLGVGNHFNSFVQSRGRESTVMIEEMKEDADYINYRQTPRLTMR